MTHPLPNFLKSTTNAKKNSGTADQDWHELLLSFETNPATKLLHTCPLFFRPTIHVKAENKLKRKNN